MQTFGQALDAMKGGCRMRRICWPEGWYIWLNSKEGRFMQRRPPSEDAMVALVIDSDILAEDWQLVPTA